MNFSFANLSATAALLALLALPVACRRKAEPAPQPVLSTLAPPTVVANEPNADQVEAITFDSIPLTDAVQALGKGAGLHIVFDKKLLSTTGPDGRSIPITSPITTVKWKNLTPKQALVALLDNYGWKMVVDIRTQTGIVTTKTAPDTATSQPPPEMFSWTNESSSDEVLTQVKFDAVPLTDAVRALAMQSGFNIQLDPKLLNAIGPDGHTVTPPTVTENWQNLTAKQALIKLLDKCGWQMVVDPRSKTGRVTAKAQKAPGSP